MHTKAEAFTERTRTMKAKTKVMIAGVIALMITICLCVPAEVSAEETPVLYPGTTSPSTGNIFVGVSGLFENYAESAALQRINEIRKEAYDEGLASSYVPVKWSKSLEYIAQIRSVEASVLEEHERPIGGYVFNMSDNGVRSYAENLAWGAWLLGSIELWYSEKADLVNNTGRVTGHYENLINPEYKYVGLGSFKANNRGPCVCAEFTHQTGLDEGRSGIAGNCIQMIEVPESDVSLAVSGTSPLKEGSSAVFSAYGKYGNFSGLILPDISWSSSNTAIAGVSGTGTVTAAAAGSVVISAQAGTLSASKGLTVEHDWNSSYTVDIPATCTKAGTESIHCAKCGAIKEGSARETQLAPHTYGEWRTTEAATCTQTGSKERFCTACNTKETGTIEALGHDYHSTVIAPTCTERGYTQHDCSRCTSSYKDTYVNAKGHTFGVWKTTTAATATQVGIQTRKCNFCDKTEIKALAPSETVTIRNTIANSAQKTNDVIWDKSGIKGATNYQLNWRKTGASTWASRNVGNTVRGTTSGLTIGSLYEIRVRPYAAATSAYPAAYGSWSNTIYRYFHTTERIRLASKSKGTFTMSWKSNPKATSYQVLYTVNSNGSGAAENIKPAPKGATSITINDIKVNGTPQKLKSGQTYYVQVREILRYGSKDYIGNISCPVAVKVR